MSNVTPSAMQDVLLMLCPAVDTQVGNKTKVIRWSATSGELRSNHYRSMALCAVKCQLKKHGKTCWAYGSKFRGEYARCVDDGSRYLFGGKG